MRQTLDKRFVNPMLLQTSDLADDPQLQFWGLLNAMNQNLPSILRLHLHFPHATVSGATGFLDNAPKPLYMPIQVQASANKW